MIAQHIQIQTRTGYARITLNQGKLLISYYIHHLAVDFTYMTLQDVEYIYHNGWNLDNLKKVVRTCEPNKTNDKLKRTTLYHE